MANQKGQFTDGQKAAYHAGYGYGCGKANKRVDVKPENQESFRNGVKRARGMVSKGKTARPTSSGAEHTDADKLKYYSARVKDKSLSQGQRDWAAKRIAALAGK